LERDGDRARVQAEVDRTQRLIHAQARDDAQTRACERGVGIGQGPVAWTPLHAADAYATLARSGLRIVPRLRMDEPLRSINLGLNPRSVAIALEGLSKAVNDERGTGHHITVDWPDGARR
ncbi:MAG: hypothetical protein ACK462_17670, partial [Planctomyces sp.]